ncbi:hypothetical protein ACGVWS_02725 [Enterobacteriaceae bacterium LUAb1]
MNKFKLAAIIPCVLFSQMSMADTGYVDQFKITAGYLNKSKPCEITSGVDSSITFDLSDKFDTAKIGENVGVAQSHMSIRCNNQNDATLTFQGDASAAIPDTFKIPGEDGLTYSISMNGDLSDSLKPNVGKNITLARGSNPISLFVSLLKANNEKTVDQGGFPIMGTISYL